MDHGAITRAERTGGVGEQSCILVIILELAFFCYSKVEYGVRTIILLFLSLLKSVGVNEDLSNR